MRIVRDGGRGRLYWGEECFEGGRVGEGSEFVEGEGVWGERGGGRGRERRLWDVGEDLRGRGEEKGGREKGNEGKWRSGEEGLQ